MEQTKTELDRKLKIINIFTDFLCYFNTLSNNYTSDFIRDISYISTLCLTDDIDKYKRISLFINECGTHLAIPNVNLEVYMAHYLKNKSEFYILEFEIMETVVLKKIKKFLKAKQVKSWKINKSDLVNFPVHIHPEWKE